MVVNFGKYALIICTKDQKDLNLVSKNVDLISSFFIEHYTTNSTTNSLVIKS